MATGKTALVLGATGGVGGETARALIRHGWHVRALTRSAKASGDDIEWAVGDAMDAAAVRHAAEGADAVIHAVNPPGYRDWDKLVLPMLDNSIAAARSVEARLVLPGTIYNYDPSTPCINENTPQRPTTRKGAIRKEMEAHIATACDAGMRALVLRAGDFFGPRPGNSWLSQGMVTPGKPITKITYPGKKHVGHAWAYLPDVGETFAQLLDRDDALPGYARFHFRGFWDADGTAFTAAIRRVANPEASVRGLPWILLPLIAPFNPTMRELIEMKPFWQQPVELDNHALVTFLDVEPHTPLDDAMRATLKGLGCL